MRSQAKRKLITLKDINKCFHLDILPDVLDKYNHEMQTKVNPVEGIFLKSSGCEGGLYWMNGYARRIILSILKDKDRKPVQTKMHTCRTQ